MSYTLREYCQLPLDERPSVRYLGRPVAWASLDPGYQLEERYMVKYHERNGAEKVHGSLGPGQLLFTNGEEPVSDA